MLTNRVRSLFCAALFTALTALTASAQKTIHIPADQPTIQAGIEAASTGDTVLIAPGIYYENLTINQKEITLISSDGKDKTILDGMGKDSVITILNTPTLRTTISGLTIQNGHAEVGSRSSGIYMLRAGATIQNNSFKANSYAVYDLFGAITFQKNVVDATGYTVCNNNGGLLLSPLDGILDTSGKPAVITIDSNTIFGSGVSCSGDGIQSDGSNIPLYVTNNRITGFAGGIGSFPNSNLFVIAQNIIWGNRQAGIVIDHAINYPEADPADTFIINNTLYNNVTAPLNSNPALGYGEDAEISIDTYSRVAVLNNIIFANSAKNTVLSCTGFPPKLGDQLTPVIFDSNIIWNAGGGTLFAGGCPSQLGSFQNINADPKFINAAAADFHLQPASPAVDSGNNSVPFLSATDIDGTPRIADATAHGSPIIDRGAYEFAGAASAPVTTLKLTASSYFLVPGTSSTLNASLTSTAGVPSGPITFLEDGVALATVNADGSGNATLTVTPTVPGSHLYEASFPGQGAFAVARAVEIYILVQKYQPKMILSAVPNPAFVGQPVTFTATITSPDGVILSPITFGVFPTAADGTVPTDPTGKAVFVKTFTYPVSLTYEADYAGDAAHFEAMATLQLQVKDPNATSTTVSSSRNPSIVGQSVTFNAIVTSTNGIPTGSIQFTDNGAVLGTQPLDATGHVSLSTSALTVGDHNITASYVPTGTFAGSSATLFQTVNAITTSVSVSSSLNPSAYGQTITVTAHIATNSGNPLSGSVTFYEGTLFLGTQPVNASGDAAVTLTASNADLSVGGHSITASFTPTGSALSVAGNFTQQVNGLPTSTLLTASPTTGIGQVTPITLNATVAPASPGGATPTGALIFYLNGGQLATVSLVNGVATYTATLPPGTNQLYAAYIGQSGGVYGGSNSNTVAVTLAVPPSTLKLSSSVNPALALTPIAFTAQLVIMPTQAAIAGQSVAFTIDGAPGGTATTDNQGIASITTQTLLPGAHTVTAMFGGTLNNGSANSSTLTEQVTPQNTTTLLLGPPGPVFQTSRVGLGVSVVASFRLVNATGTATIFEGAQPLLTGTLTPTSSSPSFVSLQLPPLSIGTHTLYAIYNPDSPAFLPSQSPAITITVLPQDFTVTLSDPTLTVQTGHHHAITISLTSIGGLTGSIVDACGTRPIYTTCASSQASVTLPANGTVSTSMVVDTNQLPGFIAAANQPVGPNDRLLCSPRRTSRDEWAVATFALTILLPFFSRKRRKHLTRLLSLLLLCALATSLTACGADKYPGSTPPGTYTIPITATMAVAPGGQPVTHTVNLTLVVAQ